MTGSDNGGQVAFDWQEIEVQLRRETGGLEGVVLDRPRVEAFAKDLAAGRLGPESNRVAADPRPATDDDVDDLERLSDTERGGLRARGEAAIAGGRIAVAVLNGGMATRFGGEVKGVLPAVGGRSFLEIKLAQARRAGTSRFLAMNSFATHRRTLAFLAERGFDDAVETFLQGMSIRLTTTGEPFRDADGNVSPYAPGHGDFPGAIRDSGILGQLAAAGVEAVLLSNVDNLGAEVDPVVVGYHLEHGDPLTVEVARTRPGDVGGAPFHVRGRLRVVEGFCLPESFDPASLRFFNTNTFAISLEALATVHPLTWFYVEKKVDGKTAVQMERLVNELSSFVPTRYLAVPRDGSTTRFLPVKTRGDLARLQADAALAARFGRGPDDSPPA